MPTNAASGASCTISLIQETQATSTATAQATCPEYRHESIKDPITNVFKEIVTIESINSGRFQINLDIKPTTCSLLERSVANQSGRTKAHKSLKPRDYVVSTIFDGIKTSSTKILRTMTGRNIMRSVTSSNGRISRPFQFAPIKLVDPDDTTQEICQNEDIMKSLGTIELKIFKCELHVDKDASMPSSSSNTNKSTNQMSFSESNKKARLSSTAGLGESKIIEPKPYTKYIAKRRPPHPFLHFIFHYKPRSILVAEGIIPNPATPTQPSVPGSPSPSTSKPGSPPGPITIDSDSESENAKNDKSKSENIKKETNVKEDRKNETGSGCQSNAKNKRAAQDDDPVTKSPNKKQRSSDKDQKPDVNQNKHTEPSKPIFIDLTL